LQHPPEKIPELINAIKDGADITIGSRYVEGGSFGKFSIGRRIISKIASGLANLFFSEIKEIKDKESGFFAFRKKVIEGVKLKPKGYKILLEIIVLGKYKNIEEIGYKFGERKAGKSKLGISIIFSYISHLISLLWASGKLIKLLKFCFVGFLGVGVNLGILYFLTNAGLHYMISGAISIEASLLANFFLNRAWTFKDEAKHVEIKKAIVRDHATRFIGIFFNYASLYIFTELFSIYYILSMLIGIILSTIWNFIGNTKWVWKY
jgi:dolichol-phosphate mannosyltransferase